MLLGFQKTLNAGFGFGFVLLNWLGTGKGAAIGIFRTSTAEEAETLGSSSSASYKMGQPKQLTKPGH